MADTITISRKCAERCWAHFTRNAYIKNEDIAELEAALRSDDGWAEVPDDHWCKEGDEIRGRYEPYGWGRVRITHYRRLFPIDTTTKAKPK